MHSYKQKDFRMNTTHDNNSESRPLGFWLKATDRLMAVDLERAFTDEGATRRDWRMLNVIDGSVQGDRPLHPRKIRGLVERGWVTRTDDGWTLTDEGTAAKERLGAIVAGVRERIAAVVSPEDYATTVATLEQIARTFGWEEGTPLPRRGRGRGFRPERGVDGRGHGRRGFGRGRFHGRDLDAEGFGPGGVDGRGRGFGHRHGGHHAHCAEHAFERGFDAGYSRAHDAHA